ncbi:MAG: cytochrome c oxidase assembly protein [Robiginitomaculum sp.]|nr:MAG: cytochrome c oxidase assembly protein [Robiginitomaculum sp.]
MPQSPDKSSRNKRFLIGFSALALAMVGAGYASVPLYNIFCKVTGYGGTTQTADVGADEVLDRMVTIRFDATVAHGLDWEFRPEQLEQKIHIGENSLAKYRAVNHSDKPITGMASYNITPQKAGVYFVKLECFCFTEQTLQPGESVDMPVIYFVSPEIADDPRLDDIKTITLSYTFFEKESAEPKKSASLKTDSGKSLH